ncbi:hypothetical protein MGH68_06810 [Erysipelothrix sp. D19-032]
MITKINVLEDDLNRLLDVWEQSVKATHTTINESMIESMRPTILTGLASMDARLCFRKQPLHARIYWGSKWLNRDVVRESGVS